MKNTKDLLDLLKLLEDKASEVRAIFCSEEYLDDSIDIVWHLIEKEYNIELNDYFSDKLCEYGEGSITKKQLLRILNKGN